MGKQSQHLKMQLRASSPHGGSHSPSDRRHTAPRAARAAREPTYGQAVRHSSGRKRNKNQLCLTNVTQPLWQAIPVQGWCWGAGLQQPPGTPFLLPLSLSSPLSPALGGAPCLISRRARRRWQGEGSLGKVSGGGAPGQMPGAFSSSIPGCCTSSCRGPLRCKPHHVHLPQGEINQSYMCTVMPANGQTPTPSSQLLIASIGSIPQLCPCLL